jgi:CorA-like Mg2+ transporter protein
MPDPTGRWLNNTQWQCPRCAWVSGSGDESCQKCGASVRPSRDEPVRQPDPLDLIGRDESRVGDAGPVGLATQAIHRLTRVTREKAMTRPGAPQSRSISVRFLVDPEHEDLAEHLEKRRFFWLDLQGPTDEQLHGLAARFGLHPLTVENARTFSQRPKIEEYGNYLFLIAYGCDPGTSSGGPLLRELHMIISGHFVVTIHRRPLKALEELRARYDEHPLRGEHHVVVRRLWAGAAARVDPRVRHLLPPQAVDVERRWDAPARLPSASAQPHPSVTR